MDFNLTEEQQLLKDSAEKFFSDEYSFDFRRQLLASGNGYSREHWLKYAELGWLGLLVSEEGGGLGCTVCDLSIVSEQFGRALVVDPYTSCAVLCAKILDMCTSFVHRTSKLQKLIEGTLILAFAHDEAEGMYSYSCITTKADKISQGYRLNGRKIVVPGLSCSDEVVVSARLENGSLCLFIVSLEAPGIKVIDYSSVDGSCSGDLILEDVEIDAASMLCSSEIAIGIMNESLDYACVSAMAQAVGAIEACIEDTAEYIKLRTQFGAPLSDFQALRHSMADMFVDAQKSRSILYQALSVFNSKPDVRRNAVSAAKIIIGESARKVSAVGVQLHGGYGITNEYVASHYFRYLFTLEKLYGDVEYHAQRYNL